MGSGQLLLMLVAAAVAQNEVSVDCGGDSVTVRWRLDSHQKLDPSRALLGDCPPNSTESGDTLLFSVSLRTCGFSRQVTPDRVTYSNLLTYERSPALPFLSHAVQCVYELPVSSTEEEDNGAVTFSLEFMNRDFSAPAPVLRFRLGSALPVRATVESRSHRPLWIYMENCMAATDADISRAAHVHPIITNAGCLMESKWGNSSFLRRRRPAEMRLYLQAFKFAVGQNIFLLCDLEAWDVQRMDRRACHYIQQQRRWELLDDPSQSYICSSCDTSFFQRTDAVSGVSARKVLGPFVIEESLDTQSSAERGPSDSPVWLIVVSVVAVLGTVAGVLAVSYYLCFWRGGRMGYRPSRDLLSKY
ncbi:zona pellucida sperm-binding protein 3-like [Carassius carassius]|uniref:zona pellucida sperm-binding protein 3-like n=1 Tax=Carassius carassius TaxID=217509 RepID=UPI00286920D0|nr:zona pellucida sperm-binding protein 3-like [Carassius carassius]